MIPILDLCRDLPEAQFAAGESILTEGQETGVLYFLISGRVEILKQGIELSTVSEPGSVFGEMSVLLDLPHMATVKALTHCRFYCAEHPLDFARSNPEIFVHISTMLAKRLHRVTSYLVEAQRHLQSGPEQALSHRLVEALKRSFAAPAS